MRKKLLIIIAYAAVLVTGAVFLLTPSRQASAGSGQRAADTGAASTAGSLEHGSTAADSPAGNDRDTDAGKAGDAAAAEKKAAGGESDSETGTGSNGADTQGSRADAKEAEADAAGSKSDAQSAGDADAANGTGTGDDSKAGKKAAGVADNSEHSDQTGDHDQTSQKQRTVKSADGRYEVTMYAEETDGSAEHDSNVRSGPAATYERAGSLRTGDAVTIVGEVKELDGTAVSPPWYEVRLEDGTTGFVRSDLLSTALEND